MLGLIGALAEETELLRDSLEDRELFEKAGLQIYRGTLRGVSAVVTCAGVGKVNAAMCAQILISEMGADTLINTGVAGGVAPGVRQGDVIVSTDAMYHDFDTTALGFSLGEIAHMERSLFPADARLQELAMAACRRLLPPGRYRQGRVVSGDQFIQSREKQEWLYRTFGAACTEMEGAAIAHVAYLNQVPFLILRSISDGADDGSAGDYQSFKETAIRTGVDILLDLLANGVGS